MAPRPGPDSAQGYAESTTETRLELDPNDVNDIIDALQAASATQIIVLEDFHYLPDEAQRDFAVALKAFHESSSYSFIIVGVWLDQNRLIQHNGDLTGRIQTVNADHWAPGDIRAAIEKGEQYLNIEFDPTFKTALIEGCLESIWVVQTACRIACEEAGVSSTQAHKRIVGDPAEVGNLIKKVVDEYSFRFEGFITNFVLGHVTTQLEMYRWILYPVLVSSIDELEHGLLYATLRRSIDAHHPDAPINAGNLTQSLQSVASLQINRMNIKPIILDYDLTNRRLNVVDRSFIIWLQYQDRAGLLDLAGLPAAIGGPAV